MADLKLVWDILQSRGDIAVNGKTLATGDELATQIYISIFSDRVAHTDDAITDGSNDPRGWWGDLDADYPIGSRLWLLDRAKLTSDRAQFAKDCVVEALQWLIDDGVVVKFDIVTEIKTPKQLGVQVTAYRTGSNGQMVASNYQYVWQGLT